MHDPTFTVLCSKRANNLQVRGENQVIRITNSKMLSILCNFNFISDRGRTYKRVLQHHKHEQSVAAVALLESRGFTKVSDDPTSHWFISLPVYNFRARNSSAQTSKKIYNVLLWLHFFSEGLKADSTSSTSCLFEG